ncbi:MAG: hypothetical protein ACLTWK_12050 [Eisenbergiella sp.]
MPSLMTAKRISSTKTSGAKSIGQIHKENSDLFMEETWGNDVNSKMCYIYDYYHDDQPDRKDHMTYEGTTKYRIDAKFIISKHQSIDKDQVEYHLQFRPSQPIEFDEKDSLFYFQNNYHDKYGIEFPVGMYCDIPDEKGVYRKWLIVQREDGNQFIKYLILPCDYRLCWIEKKGHQRIKRKMWGTQRIQQSYTIGTYVDRYFTRLDNQSKLWLPLNDITENIWYSDEESKNMRVIVGAPTAHPIAWRITKVENAKPVGIQKLTLYQDIYDQNRDYIEKDENGKIIAMWADYYDSSSHPIDPDDNDNGVTSTVQCKLNTTTPLIKIGGSYKLITAEYLDSSGINITESFCDNLSEWTFQIDGINVTDTVSVLENGFNKIKIKFPNDRKYLGKLLKIIFKDSMGYTDTLELEITV